MKRTITSAVVMAMGALLALSACSGTSTSSSAPTTSAAGSNAAAAAPSSGAATTPASAMGSSVGAAPSSAGATGTDCASISAKYPSVKGRKLIVGSSPGLDNYDAPDPKNPDTIIGVEPDLLAAIGACVGYTFTMQKQDFSGLIPALQAKHIDLIASGMYASDERAKQVSFVQYMKAGEASVVLKGNPKKLTSMDSTCGMTAAEQVGTVENAIWDKQNAACKAAGQPEIKFLSYTDGAVNALATGRADIFLTDSGVASFLANQNGKFEVGFPIVSNFVFGLGVGKKDTDLLGAMGDAMTLLHNTGKLQALEAKWGFAPSQLITPSIKS